MTVIYHNPRCSKSRQTLALLEENGTQPEVVEYLKNPPSESDLAEVISLLKIRPRELIRSNESEYKAAGLDDQTVSDSAIIAAMVKYPKLIQRPIVIHNNKAVIGRPPESVLDILS